MSVSELMNSVFELSNKLISPCVKGKDCETLIRFQYSVEIIRFIQEFNLSDEQSSVIEFYQEYIKSELPDEGEDEERDKKLYQKMFPSTRNEHRLIDVIDFMFDSSLSFINKFFNTSGLDDSSDDIMELSSLLSNCFIHVKKIDILNDAETLVYLKNDHIFFFSENECEEGYEFQTMNLFDMANMLENKCRNGTALSLYLGILKDAAKFTDSQQKTCKERLSSLYLKLGDAKSVRIYESNPFYTGLYQILQRIFDL